jgi:hypothetical protein
LRLWRCPRRKLRSSSSSTMISATHGPNLPGYGLFGSRRGFEFSCRMLYLSVVSLLGNCLLAGTLAVGMGRLVSHVQGSPRGERRAKECSSGNVGLCSHGFIKQITDFTLRLYQHRHWLGELAAVVVQWAASMMSARSSFNFANMSATSNSLTEFTMGRKPNEHSRATSSTRDEVRG